MRQSIHHSRTTRLNTSKRVMQSRMLNSNELQVFFYGSISTPLTRAMISEISSSEPFKNWSVMSMFSLGRVSIDSAIWRGSFWLNRQFITQMTTEDRVEWINCWGNIIIFLKPLRWTFRLLLSAMDFQSDDTGDNLLGDSSTENSDDHPMPSKTGVDLTKKSPFHRKMPSLKMSFSLITFSTTLFSEWKSPYK